MKIFILDACALIAYFSKEDGAEAVKNILRNAIDDGSTKVFINKINLLEVYYDVIKAYDEKEADKMLETVKKMPLEIIVELNDAVFKKAGQLKAKYKISIADSIAIAETIMSLPAASSGVSLVEWRGGSIGCGNLSYGGGLYYQFL